MCLAAQSLGATIKICLLPAAPYIPNPSTFYFGRLEIGLGIHSY